MTGKQSKFSVSRRSPALMAVAVLVGATITAAATGDSQVSDTAAPVQTTQAAPAPNPLKNAYFGDLHVHTKVSIDSYLQRNMLTMADAYHFAQGGAVVNASGETVQLARPLDFVALTDHSENFAAFDLCVEGVGPASRTESCNLAKRQKGVGTYVALGDLESAENCGGSKQECAEARKRTWQFVQKLANESYRPGIFTTLIGYEFSSAGGPGGYSWHNHRNVIFSSETVTSSVFSALDSNNAADLWKWLETECTAPCDVIAIPHNSNLSSGVHFGMETVDNRQYSDQDWSRRARFERLAEIFQIKGDSECMEGFGSVDELCGMESFATDVPRCPDGQPYSERNLCLADGSFVRNALKAGLALQERLGFNPLKLGIIGSTDNHSSLPGSTDSKYFSSWWGAVDGTSELRLKNTITSNPGGLAGVWAPQNTRADIFAALKARETFGTSGTRVKVRLFGGWNFDAKTHLRKDFVARGYRYGVPMGQDLPARTAGAPSFVVWSQFDPESARLQRLQIVKGWSAAAGELSERVYDITCSDGLRPDPKTHLCPNNKADVSLKNCAPSANLGATELATTWRDPDFDPNRPVFYYVRVIENPSCRWSTWEALRADRPIPPFPAPTVQQRAWSSPIWYWPADLRTAAR